ncbi:uncharacterized protein LOC131152774 isoform X8 [Malania oleifera]|uniref:uncharacterized protein LOC131152774 isoform X8 n=1 Tax=Malania oleifera TaxID=397392 RepID=UPI0025AEAF30|nr:uncharacterized protein LOC131152774 isoform X8 [Malania oleifera]
MSRRYNSGRPTSSHPSNTCRMENGKGAEVASLLKVLPPVEFCCVYGSSLHPNNCDKSKMIDYILGVKDPMKWHSKNLKMNRDHYASLVLRLGGARLITDVANDIGAGVHFNSYVSLGHKLFKYGVVRMNDLIQDIMCWETFYLSGRLQKPVHILVDTLDVGNVNFVNLRAATSAALLLLPSKFTEEDLYARICGLSYMGDLRMLFAEDKNKDCSLSSVRSLVASLPSTIRNQMGLKLGENRIRNQSGRTMFEVMINSREEAAQCMQKVLRQKVMGSSVRQAVSGLLAVGCVNAARYAANKMLKAWKSWT